LNFELLVKAGANGGGVSTQPFGIGQARGGRPDPA
jgi:hypothetical protein